MEDQNSKAYLDKAIEQIVDNIGGLLSRPGVQLLVNGGEVFTH